MLLLLLIATILIIIILNFLQYYFFNFDQSFFEGMMVNLISEIIVLSATVFILDRLIRRHYTKRSKTEQKQKYINNLASRHESLAAVLEYSYIHFVTKSPAQFFNEDEQRKKDKKLTKVVEELKSYISEDFSRINYKVIIVDPVNVNRATDQTVSYQWFLKTQFKEKILNATMMYTSRYIGFIPEEILTSIFLIEDTLNKNVFSVPEDHGLKADINRWKFNQQEMYDSLNVIGRELIKIKEYI